MTESNGARLAAVLPANPQLDLWTRAASIFNSYPYEPSHPFGVKNLERVICKNTPIYVRGKEPAGIVSAKPHGSLGKIICSK